MKKCNNCGNMSVDLNAIACPDCGDENNLVVLEATAAADSGSTSSAAPALAPASEPAAEVAAETTSESEPAMPAMDMSMDQRPVVASIVLPDKTVREMREGDSLTVANDRYEGDVDVRLPDDEAHAGVSGTEIFTLSVKDGKVSATGGGGNGFKVVVTVRHKSDDSVEVEGGNSIVLGRSTVLRIT